MYLWRALDRIGAQVQLQLQTEGVRSIESIRLPSRSEVGIRRRPAKEPLLALIIARLPDKFPPPGVGAPNSSPGSTPVIAATMASASSPPLMIEPLEVITSPSNLTAP